MADGANGIRRDWFVSRAGADKEIASAISQIIRDTGATTWIQDEFGPASFLDRMAQDIDGGARTVALLSAGFQTSDYTRKEAYATLHGDPLNLRERLVIVRVGDCAPAGLLKDLAYTDLVPTLALADPVLRLAQLTRIIRVLVGAETGAAEIDFARLHRVVPKIRHSEIIAVAGFIGRDAELEALDTTLWRKGTGSITALTNPRANAPGATTAVRGLGGVGKSVLAKQYAWDNRARYRGVWWVRADRRETMLDDIIGLGARMIPGLQEEPNREKAAQVALAVIDQTGAGKPWLMVYDNVEEPEDIRKLTPTSGAHVIVTTRWQDWYGEAAELPVGVFTPEAATDFLLAHARGADVSPEATRASAKLLAEELGYLPLALAHARATCWGNNWGFDTYRANVAELIKRAPRGAEYPEAVFATFELALRKAIEVCPEAEKLLGVAAFLAPDRIPLGIITSDFLSEIAKGNAVAALAEVSLIERETFADGTPAMSVHRLVQAVMRERLGEAAGDAAAAVATILVARAFPSGDVGPDDVRSWPACRRLESHAKAVLAFAPETGPAAQLTSRLLNQYAVHLYARADHAAAEPLYRRALAIDEANFGPDHHDVAIDLNNLAALLQDTNRLDEAEPLMRRALAIDEASFGPDHPKVAIDLNNLAALLQDTNRLAEAEPLMRRALAIDEASIGPDHHDVAIDLNNLAALLRVTNRLTEAEPLYRRARAINEASFGPDHPNVAIDLNNLAQLLTATDRLEEAEPIFRRALAIDKASLGPDHPNVAIRLNNLARLLQASGRLGEAEPLMRRVVEIFEGFNRATGHEHPHYRAALRNLAALEVDLRTAEEAAAAPPEATTTGVRLFKYT